MTTDAPALSALGSALASVGPMSLGEHVGWFVLLSLVLFLVYHGLRVDSVGESIVRGVKRWFMFALGTALLGACFHLLVRTL
jgi:hypothetical protein